MQAPLCVCLFLKGEKQKKIININKTNKKEKIRIIKNQH